MHFNTNTTLVMTGDTITESGRAKPLADKPSAIGNGYVKYITGEIRAKYSELIFKVINEGLHDETSTQLSARWGKDILSLKPQYISIMIGAHEIVSLNSSQPTSDSIAQVSAYQLNIESIIKQSISSIEKIYLLSPFIYDSHLTKQQHNLLLQYGHILQELANQYDCIFIDLHSKFDNVINSKDPAYLLPASNRIITNAFLKAIDF